MRTVQEISAGSCDLRLLPEYMEHKAAGMQTERGEEA